MRSAKGVVRLTAAFAFGMLGAQVAIAGTVAGVREGDYYDADNNADLIFEGESGTPALGFLRIDLMEGTSIKAGGEGFLETGGGAWQAAAIGDLTGNSRSDIASNGATGTPAEGFVRIQFLDGTTQTGETFVGNGGGAWEVFDIADADAQNGGDLFFAGVPGTPAEGLVRIDFVDNLGAVTGSAFVGVGAGVSLDAVHDINGDNNADLVLLGATSVQVIFLSAGSAIGDLVVDNGGGAWSFFDVANVDGQNAGDLVFVGQSGTGAAGFNRVDFITAAGTVSSQAFFENGGNAWELSQAGDVDGDGTDDFVSIGAGLSPAFGFNRVQIMNGASAPTAEGFFDNGGGAWALMDIANIDGANGGDLIAVGMAGSPADGFVRVQTTDAAGTAPAGEGFLENGGGAWLLF